MSSFLRKIVGATVILFSATFTGYSQDYLQSQNKKWITGKYSGLDFSLNNEPQIMQSAIPGFYGNENWYGNTTASISDAHGNLLFYTDGDRVWNRDHQVMPNGTGITMVGNGYGTFRVGRWPVIVPMPGNSHKYYLFSRAAKGMGGNLDCTEIGQLYYCIVDMQLQNGLGNVEDGHKGIVLDNNLAAVPIAAIKGDDCNTWVLVHASDTNQFRAWNITAEGIATQPVLSYGGHQVYPGSTVMGMNSDIEECEKCFMWEESYFQVSNDGRKLIMNPVSTSELGTHIEYFDFSPASGTLSNPLHVYYLGFHGHLNPQGAFSPDNTKFYTFSDVWHPGYSLITGSIVGGPVCQFDLTQPIPALEYLVDQGKLLGLYGYNPKLGPDGRIYFFKHYQPNGLYTNTTQDSMGVINFPDQTGIACSVTTVNLPRHANFLNSLMPPFAPIQPVDSVSTYNLFCNTDTAMLLARDTTGTDYIWSDNTTGPKHELGTDSLYIVQYFDKCVHHTDSFARTFPPQVILGADTSLCPGDMITLRAQGGFSGNEHYLWSTMATSVTIDISLAGSYWLKVMEPPCEAGDSIIITENMLCDCRFQIPNAFSPNGDGNNDRFLPVIKAACPVNNYLLSIYNRYGQRVYTGTRQNEGWDGTQRGIVSDAGTYFYELRYEAGVKEKSYYQKGDLILIR